MNRDTLHKQSGGYVILFTVLISSVLLAITLGVVSVALKEQYFTRATRDSSEAFYAADVITECGLYSDENGLIDPTLGDATITCEGQTLPPSPPQIQPDNSILYQFDPVKIGDNHNRCGYLEVTKNTPVGTDTTGTPILGTRIVGRGRNQPCDYNPTNNPQNLVERSLEYNYESL